MSNVLPLPGCRKPNAGPNQSLIDSLRDLLRRAEDGELQSLIGTGFMADGMRMSMWCDHHENVYEMLGALAWLESEYVKRVTERR